MAGIFDRIAGASGTDETELTVEPMALDYSMDDEQPLMSAAVQVDERRTPQRVREAVQEMLKYGLLEESHKPNLYRSALSNIEAVDRVLEPLDLAMGVDEVRGLVFVTVRQGEAAEQDDWSHPLVRRQRLNLEQSLLIAILRQQFIAYGIHPDTGQAYDWPVEFFAPKVWRIRRPEPDRAELNEAAALIREPRG